MNSIKKFFLNLNLIHKNKISKKNYFSFSGVDIIIENIFREKNNGFYVDVGCQHPIKNNNTYLLHKKGWEGINLDLDTDNINPLNQAYKVFCLPILKHSYFLNKNHE